MWTNGSAPVPAGTNNVANLSLSNNANVWVTGDVGSASTRQNITSIGTTGVNATLTISNGTFYSVSPNDLRIGFNASAATTGGRLILEGGNLDSAGNIRLGPNDGKGLLEVRSGRLTNSGELQMGANNFGSSALKATLRVTGTNASAHFGSLIQVGGSSQTTTAALPQALVEVSNGGVLTSGALYLDSLGTRGTNGTTGSTPNARLVVDGGYYTNTSTVRFGISTNSRASIDVTGGGVFQARRIETVNSASNAQKLLTFNVSNGTLRVNELSLLDAQLNNGGALTIGNGTSASALELLGSTNAIVVTNGIAIAANSQLRHTTATNATVASSISGAGSVVKSGTGTLTLVVTNSYIGGTVIGDGVLEVQSMNQLGNSSSATTNVVLAGGNLRYAGTTNETSTRGFQVSGSTSANGINVSNAEVTLTLSGTQTGLGTFHKLGEGALALTGNGAARTGTTVVEAGTLIVDGSLGGTTIVKRGATLAGSGSIGGDVTISGTHRLGIQTLNGNLTYTGADVKIESTANATTEGGQRPMFDQAVVSGSVDFSTPTMLALRFTGVVDWDDEFWDREYTGTAGWRVFQAGEAINRPDNLRLQTTWLDSRGRELVRGRGVFTLHHDPVSHAIYLNYRRPSGGGTSVGFR